MWQINSISKMLFFKRKTEVIKGLMPVVQKMTLKQ